jgi:hypothetical protein
MCSGSLPLPFLVCRKMFICQTTVNQKSTSHGSAGRLTKTKNLTLVQTSNISPWCGFHVFCPPRKKTDLCGPHIKLARNGVSLSLGTLMMTHFVCQALRFSLHERRFSTQFLHCCALTEGSSDGLAGKTG